MLFSSLFSFILREKIQSIFTYETSVLIEKYRVYSLAKIQYMMKEITGGAQAQYS